MSANPEDSVDFEQVAAVEPPAKKAAAKPATKTPPKAQPKSREEIRAELAAEFDAREASEETDMEKLRAEIRAELEAEYRQKLAEAAPPVDTSVDGLEETPYLHVEVAPGEVVIHMVDDGLTFGTRVYMRGEELALDPSEHPWVKYSRAQQVHKLGKHFFAPGPWPYGGYDLTDPNLTAEDKKRLLRATSESFG